MSNLHDKGSLMNYNIGVGSSLIKLMEMDPNTGP